MVTKYFLKKATSVSCVSRQNNWGFRLQSEREGSVATIRISMEGVGVGLQSTEIAVGLSSMS